MKQTPRALVVVVILGGMIAVARAGDEPASDLVPLVPVGQTRVFDNRYYGPTGNPFALSPDGKCAISTGGNNQLMVYDLSGPRRNRQGQGRILQTENPNFYRPSLAFMPDSKIVAGMSNNYPDYNVHFWNVLTGKEVRQIDNDQQFNSLAISADGKLLALGTSQRVEIWDAATTDDIRIVQGPPNVNYVALAFSADGRMLAGANNNAIQVWETATGQERTSVRLHNNPAALANFGFGMPMNPTASSLGFSADGAILAAGGHDNSIRLWNLHTGQELPPLVGHQANVSALVFTADGRRLMSLDSNGLKLDWDVRRLAKTGTAKPRAPGASEMAELWESLADADAFQTFRTARLLAAGGTETIAFLQARLKPVPAGNTEQISQLINGLQNPSGAARRKAMAGLRLQGEAALGALTQAVQNNQGFNQNVGMMLNKLENTYNTSNRQRAVKAIQVLEEIGSPQAKVLLDKLAKGAPGARLTEAAKTALAKLKSRATPGQANVPDPQALWNDLAGLDAVKAYRSIVQLAAQPDKTLPFLREHLKPAPVPDVKHVEELVAALGNDDYLTRQKATVELQKLGEAAIPTLKKALTAQLPLEAQKRVEQLLSKLNTQNLSPFQLQQLRALEVLEQIASPEARQLLQQLAQGAPVARLTREARAGLERLEKRMLALK